MIGPLFFDLINRFLGELQMQGNAKGSDIFTMQEMQQFITAIE